MLRTILTLSALLPLAGCYVDEQNDPGLHEFRTTWSCSTCGGVGNSPAFNDLGIPHLHVGGDANEDGVKIKGFLSPQQKHYELHVVKDEFVAYLEGDVAVTGAELIGWWILLDSPEGELQVRITAYDDAVPSLAVDGPKITAYALSYTNAVGERSSVCPDALDATAPAVTLIQDETYDRDAKTVEPHRPGWFTLACAGEAVFKMKRMNYGPAADFDGHGHPASVDQRQATLKMITADYCGAGRSFTHQGTSVLWYNAGGSVDPQPSPGAQPEALWTAHGAVCLDVPRVEDKAYVELFCSLPSCAFADPSKPDVEWRTLTP
jgi:hypothetical protein